MPYIRFPIAPGVSLGLGAYSVDTRDFADVSNKLLSDVGRALYGERWQGPLSRDLEVSDRTMRRWATGFDDIPRGVNVDLMRLVSERIQTLEDLIEPLKRVGS